MQLVTVDDVLTMMGDTSSLGEKGEVEKLVAAVARLFSPGDDDYPYLPYPTGYSGDVNKVRRLYTPLDVLLSKAAWQLLLVRGVVPYRVVALIDRVVATRYIEWT